MQHAQLLRLNQAGLRQLPLGAPPAPASWDSLGQLGATPSSPPAQGQAEQVAASDQPEQAEEPAEPQQGQAALPASRGRRQGRQTSRRTRPGGDRGQAPDFEGYVRRLLSTSDRTPSSVKSQAVREAWKVLKSQSRFQPDGEHASTLLKMCGRGNGGLVNGDYGKCTVPDGQEDRHLCGNGGHCRDLRQLLGWPADVPCANPQKHVPTVSQCDKLLAFYVGLGVISQQDLDALNAHTAAARSGAPLLCATVFFADFARYDSRALLCEDLA